MRRMLGYVHYRKVSPPSEPGRATAVGICATAVGMKSLLRWQRRSVQSALKFTGKIQGRRQWRAAAAALKSLLWWQKLSIMDYIKMHQKLIKFLIRWREKWWVAAAALPDCWCTFSLMHNIIILTIVHVLIDNTSKIHCRLLHFNIYYHFLQ